MEEHYSKYYNLEDYLSNVVREKFNYNGYLNAFDFFCIVIWKANRAKSKIAKRLLGKGTDLEAIVKELTMKINREKGHKERFKILYKDYGFRLPIASAILSILMPDEYTVYDFRVCETLTEFKDLKDISGFEKVWYKYEKYVLAVTL